MVGEHLRPRRELASPPSGTYSKHDESHGHNNNHDIRLFPFVSSSIVSRVGNLDYEGMYGEKERGPFLSISEVDRMSFHLEVSPAVTNDTR